MKAREQYNKKESDSSFNTNKFKKRVILYTVYTFFVCCVFGNNIEYFTLYNE